MDQVTAIQKFQALLEKGIDVRKNALNPENTLFRLRLGEKGKEGTQDEIEMLTDILYQFNLIFEVE